MLDQLALLDLAVSLVLLFMIILAEDKSLRRVLLYILGTLIIVSRLCTALTDCSKKYHSDRIISIDDENARRIEFYKTKIKELEK